MMIKKLFNSEDLKVIFIFSFQFADLATNANKQKLKKFKRLIRFCIVVYKSSSFKGNPVCLSFITTLVEDVLIKL